MSKDLKMNQNNMNQQLIIAGLAGLIDEGHTPHDVFVILEDIKRKTFPALGEIHRENKEKVKG